MQCMESKIWRTLIFASLNLTFITGQKAFPVFHADRVIQIVVKVNFPEFGTYNVIG